MSHTKAQNAEEPEYHLIYKANDLLWNKWIEKLVFGSIRLSLVCNSENFSVLSHSVYTGWFFWINLVELKKNVPNEPN